MSNIFTAPVYELKALNNLFIELSAKNCNQRCKCCYLDLPISLKPVKDFISLDKIKECLADINKEKLHCIYLIGAEPMLHPDFNAILRLCLKFTNVCICTNGSYLNEKKIRFLKKVEDEGAHQIYFKLSVTHFDEIENDKVKYRGNFRQTLFVLKVLSRYHFTSVLSIQNYYNLKDEMILEVFKKMFSEQEIFNVDLQITKSFPCFNEENLIKASIKTDCMHGRVLTSNGIYACPFLSNDYRGRAGSSIKDFSKNVIAETDYCATCSNNNDFIFTIG